MAAVTLIVGDEEFLVAQAVSRACAQNAADMAGGEAAGLEAEVREAEAGELGVDDIAELTSPSLFGDTRAVVIRGLQDASKDVAAALASYTADAADAEVSLVLVHAGGAKGKAVVDAVKHAGARVVEVPKIKTGRDREQFVVDTVRAAGGSIDRDAVTQLVGALGNDLRELAVAAEQLVGDVGRRITLDDVATHHRGRAESSGFAVADRAVEGDVAAALETLRWAMSTGLDPVLVSSSLAANLRMIAVVGAAGRGSPDSLAGVLGMPPWKIRRAQGWLSRWRPDALAAAVEAVAAADADIKGAGDDAAYAAERAVITVATCAAR